jgi:hypothetical protein
MRLRWKPDCDADARPSPRRRGRKPTHGLKTLRKSITVLGTQRLDGRSQVAKAVQAFRRDIIADLGGSGNVSRAKLAIVEQASRQWVMLSSVDDSSTTPPRTSSTCRRH